MDWPGKDKGLDGEEYQWFLRNGGSRGPGPGQLRLARREEIDKTYETIRILMFLGGFLLT